MVNSPRKQHLLAGTYYIGLVIAMTYPLIFRLHTHFIGDLFSDAYEYNHHIWWMNHALRNGESMFHVQPLAYPDGLNGAWLWGNPLQSFPAWLFLFVLPPPAAYNLSALITLSLNGWTTYFLCWRLTGKFPAALLGGTIFALYPTIQGHLIGSHVGLVTLWGVPLYALALFNLRERGDWRSILLTALWFVVSILGNSLLLVYALFPITLAFILVELVNRRWRVLWRTIIAGIIGSAIALVFIAPIVLEQINSPVDSGGGDVRYSADLLAIVTPSFYNPLFTNLTYSRSILGGVNNVEGSAYIGVIAATLALIGLWRQQKSRWWGVLALFAWILSLGPLLKVVNQLVTIHIDKYESHIVLPWAVLMNVPVLNIARTPARFNFIVGLSLAVMAAYGFSWLITHQSIFHWRWLIVAILVPIIAFEYQVWWENGLPELRTTIDLQADEITALRDNPNVRAVFNIPSNHLLTAKDGMYLQTRHQKPMIAGHVTRRTPVSPAKLNLLEQTLNPALLKEAGADVIILHRYWTEDDGALETFARQSLGEPFYESERLISWYVPAITETPDFTALPLDGDHISSTSDSYVYLPAAGWVNFHGTLSAQGNAVTLLLNNMPVQVWAVDDALTFDVPLYMQAGYHTISLAIPGECPRLPSDAVTCRTVQVHQLEIDEYTPAAAAESIEFDRGIALSQSFIAEPANNTLSVYLQWYFASGLNDSTVRFVTLVDENGTVAQSDVPLGNLSADTTRFESITLDLTDIPAGNYTAYVGWYTYPDIARIPVLSNVDGARDGWVMLGEVTVP